MAAPKGNQFWKLRSKHGRDKLFASPELLWVSACEYFEWCDENPLYEEVIEKVKVNGVGDELRREKMPKMRPYTLHALCLYLDCNSQYFKTFKSQLTEKDKAFEDFNTVITRIEETIFNQKFEGASVGFFNANIIARDLGLADKKDIQAEVTSEITNHNIDYSNLSTETLMDLLKNSQKKD